MRTSWVAVSAAAVLSLLVAACSPQSSSSPQSPAASAASGSTKTPADPLAAMSADAIAQKALAGLKAAPAVHVSGSLTDSGATIGLNLTTGTTTCAGTISESGSGSFQILQSGTTVWIKPDAKFWKTAGGNDPSVLSVVEGKYLKTTTKDSSFSSLIDLCRPAKLAGLFGKPAGLVKGRITVISGQRALPLQNTGDSGAVDVSDSAVPRLLQLSVGSSQRLDFTGYGVPASVTPPAAGETLSGSQYGF